MENPDTWGEAENVVKKILDAFFSRDTCGGSLERQITDALREAGLLKDSNG